MKDTYTVGIDGELEAASFLTRKGMKLLATRYRCKCGEIDLILLDGDVLVFAEVKTRRDGVHGSGLLAIDGRKQRRIAQAASYYLTEHHEMNRCCRFDAVEITSEGVLHIPNAFQLSRVI